MAYRSDRKRKTFSSPAWLEGKSFRVPCIVMGTREYVPGEGPRLIRVSITQEPHSMLDGLYTVRFGEESVQVERRGGLWLMT